MKRGIGLAAVLAAAVLALASLPARAQGNATVVGVVIDSSGAVVPRAAAILINEATGVRYASAADEAGRYTFSFLPVGNYRLEVTAPGFRRTERRAINLTSEQTLSVDVALEVGEVSETVNVSAAVSALETSSSTIRSLVRRELIADLPLNGRNALQLQSLLPGAVRHAGARTSFSQEDGVAVNGARGNDNNVLLDGGHNNDVYTGVPTSLPNPDALQEFSVLSSSFSAEYGRGAGSLVAAVTKSGTNAIHGTAYDFLRNDALDARSFFGHAGLVDKPKLKRNQFGVSVGGPLVRDRSFLFGAWESLRERRAVTQTGLIVPTAKERAGDFSDTRLKPVDPANRQPFPNHVIPRTRHSEAAVKLNAILVPLPNFESNQLIYNSPSSDDRDQAMARFDHNFSANDRLNLSYFYSDTYITQNFNVPLANGFGNWTNNRGLANYVKVISPSTLNSLTYTLNHLNFGRGALPILPDQYPGNPPALAPGLRYEYFGVKTKSATPQFPINTRLGGISGYYAITGENFVGFTPYAHEVRDTLTLTRSGHLIKLGGEFSVNRADRSASNEADGVTFNWTGQRAGNGYADYLLGLPANYTQQSLLRSANRFPTLGFFVQDDWKATRTLTLNLGLRWEPNFGIYDGRDEIVAFHPGKKSAQYPNAPAGMVYPGDPGVSRTTYADDWNNLAPRIGLAWLPFGPGSRTSIRSAYGIFYNTSRGYLLNEAQLNQPFVLRIRINDPASFEDPWQGFPGGDPFPFSPPANREEKQRYRFVTPTSIGRYFPPDNATPYHQQWNFTLQHEVIEGTVLGGAYVGSKGTRLHINYEVNQAAYTPGNDAAGRPLSTTANIDARRPWRDFQSIDAAATVGNSTYHSLQLSLNRRLSKGLYVMANYTYSKALDLQSLDRNAGIVQDSYDFRADRGPADFDRRHNFVTSFLAEIPSPWKAGLKGKLTQGWQTNGIVSYLSGTPTNVVPGTDRALQGSGNQRADVIGDCRLSTDRPFDEQRKTYFNVAAFRPAAVGQFGNFSRNGLYGPGGYNLDLSFFKTTRMTESASVQFRWEMFNAFNHANLGNPVTTYVSAAFGQINTVTGPRIMQAGLKLIF